MNVYAIPRYSWFGAACTSLITDSMLAVTNWTLVFLLSREKSSTPIPELAQA